MRVYGGDIKLGDADLEKLFLQQLSNVYCIKKHLVKILPALSGKALFPDLKNAILDNTDQIKLQLLRMDVVYKIYDAHYKNQKCKGLKAISMEAYADAFNEKLLPVESDLALLIHLQIIESVEVAYFNILKNIAGSLRNKEVQIMLEQNFESAVSGKKLYDLIAREYIA